MENVKTVKKDILVIHTHTHTHREGRREFVFLCGHTHTHTFVYLVGTSKCNPTRVFLLFFLAFFLFSVGFPIA